MSLVPCCELLSFFSIFGIQHNEIYDFANVSYVVNCFHFSVSLGYNTTSSESSSTNFVLWIAFIFQYLWDTTQLDECFLLLHLCCELLSFFSIFGIQHNDESELKAPLVVVNCFHFSVSSGYKISTRYIGKHL